MATSRPTCAVNPLLMNTTEEQPVPAGTIAVIADKLIQAVDDDGLLLPEGTLLCAGQSLSRKDYPELSSIYHDAGGFHHFTLPDLTKKFIIGVSQEGEIEWGSGIIYYESFPPIPRRSVPEWMQASSGGSTS